MATAWLPNRANRSGRAGKVNAPRNLATTAGRNGAKVFFAAAFVARGVAGMVRKSWQKKWRPTTPTREIYW